MPIYEYRCEDCGTKFEKLVRRSDADAIECPSCNQKHLQQEYSTFSARATNGGSKAAEMPSCPGGGPCRNPGMCGMN